MATLEQVKKDAAAQYLKRSIDGWLLRTFGFAVYVWVAIIVGALWATVVIVALKALGII